VRRGGCCSNGTVPGVVPCPAPRRGDTSELLILTGILPRISRISRIKSSLHKSSPEARMRHTTSVRRDAERGGRDARAPPIPTVCHCGVSHCDAYPYRRKEEPRNTRNILHCMNLFTGSIESDSCTPHKVIFYNQFHQREHYNNPNERVRDGILRVAYAPTRADKMAFQRVLWQSPPAFSR